MQYKKIDPKQSFPALEEEILRFWKENKIFEKSMENRKEAEEFNFYDGPPFATGTPHYGHILAGTIKDIIPRYQTMKGKYVERRFGWDCHGLPIENIVEKKLGISGKLDIENKIGVFKFNEECKKNVLTYVNEWRKSVERIGRWVDMDNDYKTMEPSFMESIWRVFKNIYDKGLIYESNRVVPYCPRCSTPLSNFEVNQGYKDKQDKSITVKFKVQNQNKYILAWTTTPWTLPGNLGLALGKDIIYAEIEDKSNNEIYILAKEKIKDFYKNNNDFEILNEYLGKQLIGIDYEPIFDYYNNEYGRIIGNNKKFTENKIDFFSRGDLPNFELRKNSWKTVLGHHVTTETGTGIVHIAPAFGEDDNIIGKENDLGYINHIDDTGKVINLENHLGEYVFDFNENVIQLLKTQNRIVKISSINHSYPFCRRCDTPLIYRGISAWYVAVEQIKDNLIKNNNKINWIPETIKYGRFGKWIEGARDWNISRNRYWGSAIPVWQSEDKTEEICIGSIQELYELNKEFGQIVFKDGKYYFKEDGNILDIHKHYVDKILIKNPKTGSTLKRIPEVLDCWFESGAMPYASKHYPFENKDNFKFPADFIAEGLDQTRGWFYTLLVLATALFDNTSFLNVIVNGIVLAEDGRKMSKSLKNYPDPNLIMDKYGADAMRLYLINSPVVKADDLRFSENGVEEIVKKVILPLWNTYYFFSTYAQIDNFKPEYNNLEEIKNYKFNNNLDKWIISALNVLIKNISNEMDKYDLQKATDPIFEFMDNLTNWYIRRSRRRFWKSENDNDKLQGYETLYIVLIELSKVLAPFIPFITEKIYKDLTGKESVHLENYPTPITSLIDENLNLEMDLVQKTINLGLNLRTSKKIRVRQPLASLIIATNFSEYYQDILKEELNVKEVIYNPELTKIVRKVCRPNAKILGPRIGKDIQNVIAQAKAGNFEELPNGQIKVGEHILNEGEYEISFEKTDETIDIQTGFGLVISMDTNITQELKDEGYARDIVRFIQEARKEADYHVNDRIQISISGEGVKSILDQYGNYIQTETLSSLTADLTGANIDKNIQIEDLKINIKLKK